MEKLNLGMFETNNNNPAPPHAYRVPSTPEEHPCSTNHFRSIFNALLHDRDQRDKERSSVPPSLPPCPLCSSSRPRWFLEGSAKDLRRRNFELTMRGGTSLGPLGGYGERFPDMTLEEKTMWRAMQRLGTFGVSVAVFSKWMRDGKRKFRRGCVRFMSKW